MFCQLCDQCSWICTSSNFFRLHLSTLMDAKLDLTSTYTTGRPSEHWDLQKFVQNNLFRHFSKTSTKIIKSIFLSISTSKTFLRCLGLNNLKSTTKKKSFKTTDKLKSNSKKLWRKKKLLLHTSKS